MKKLLALALSTVIAFSAVGCSEPAEDTKWISEASSKVSKEITSGQFVIDGVVYEFPMDLKYWLDNGWHVSNNYNNVDKFKLEPGTYSNEFELFNDNKQYVTVSVINDNDKDCTVKECKVYSVEIKLSNVDTVLPQGITKRSKPAEIKSAYGEPTSQDNQRDYVYMSYTYEADDESKCVAELEVFDNKTTLEPCSVVKYYFMSFDEIWDNLVEEKGIEEACKIYMNATMKASYQGDFKDYVDFCIVNKSDAEKLYQSEISYFAEFLRYYTDLTEDYVSDDTKARFEAVAKKVLSKVFWEVQSVEDKGSGDCELTIKLYPTNFLDIIDADVTEAIDKWNEKYEDVDFDSLSDAEYAACEQEYIEAILVVMENNADKAGTKDALTGIYEIDTEDNFISDEDWDEIDDVLMDAYEE